MVLKKKVPRLEEACIDSIVYNLVHHAEKSEKCSVDSDMYDQYKTIKYLFTSRIMKAFERIQREYDPNAILALWKMRRAIPSCLRFLLNEYTTRVDGKSFWETVGFTPSEVLTALQKCKDLKILQMQYVPFPKNLFVACLPQWRNLVSVDLYKSSCNNEMMIGIFENCPDIQELRVTGESIANTALFYLCKNRGVTEHQPFCNESGECCNLGKKLTILKMYGTQVDMYGLASALQHLHSLRTLEDGFLNGVRVSITDYPPNHNLSHACNAISWLRWTCAIRQAPLPQLKLRTLFISENYDANVNPVMYSCPEIQRLVVQPSATNGVKIFSLDRVPSLKELYLSDRYGLLKSTPQFHEFLRMKGPQLEKVSLSALRSISLRLIRSILRNCVNLRQLHIGDKKCFPSSNSLCDIYMAAHEDGPDEIFSCIENLDKIRLYRLLFRDESSVRFFSELLTRASNVKDLTICSILAERSLESILECNRFKKLKRIEIVTADLKHVSLEPLLNFNSNLKKIASSWCINSKPFVEKHQEIVQRNGLQLDFESL